MAGERGGSFVEISENVKQADELDRLQALENEGRGVSCVRTLAFHLRRGEIELAKAVAENEGDKIRNYPSIKQYLIEQGLMRKSLVLGEEV